MSAKTKTRAFAAFGLLCIGAALSLGAYAYTCQQNCQTQYVNCIESGTLPLYKCQQIYNTCLNQCGGNLR
ncbi:MAG TPA: hypothetical protein VJ806_15305 [Luteimonas sp.]|nr:hypothetical protein [Luteimonas sp.]